ncbi:hypothetical protein ACN20G_21515 [Streptomyces sp. BI20]|uniref:hypothetical protein n=1 Tax=Streptomyces sp. BI20 TaxID=3403460 RepID=UPI003C792ED8
MRARPGRAVALLAGAVVVTGLVAPVLPTDPPLPPADVRAVAALAGATAHGDLARVDALREPGARPPVDPPAEPPAPPPRPASGGLFGADCAVVVTGSTVAADCHNPYPDTDRIRLHVECDRWWDVDGDSAATAVLPAGRTRLLGRCWKEVRAAWVTHHRQD